MPVLRAFRHALLAAVGVLGILGSPLVAQADREWHPVAWSGAASAASQLPSDFPTVVESTIGGRSPMLSWNTVSNSVPTTTMLIGVQSGSSPLVKMTFQPGVAPQKSTPVMSPALGITNFRVRSLIRTSNGTIFGVMNRVPEGVWPMHGVVDVSDVSYVNNWVPTSFYDGYLLVSMNDGATFYGHRITNNGQIGSYFSSNSVGGYAIRLGAPGCDNYEIKEFTSNADALAYSSIVFSVTQNGSLGVPIVAWFGVKKLNIGSVGQGELFGESVVDAASGGYLGSILRYESGIGYWRNDCSGGSWTLTYFGYGTPILGPGAKRTTYGGSPNIPYDGMQFFVPLTGAAPDGFYGAYCGSYPASYGFSDIKPYSYDRRREKAVATYDNTGVIVREFYAKYSNDLFSLGGNWSDVKHDGVFAYRGPIANFIGGASGLPQIVSGGAATSYDTGSLPYFKYVQESYAGFDGFMAVASSSANNGKPFVYLTETKPSGAFTREAVAQSTTVDSNNTNRMMLAGLEAMSFSTPTADRNAWNGRIVTLGQVNWSAATPGAFPNTYLSVYAVPSRAEIAAVVDGVQVADAAVSGCGVILRGVSVTGEPEGRYYYAWQRQNSDGSWPVLDALSDFQGEGTFAAGTGAATIPDYVVPVSGTYRLVVTGVVGGLIYEWRGGRGTELGVVSDQAIAVTLVSGLTVAVQANPDGSTWKCSSGSIVAAASGAPDDKVNLITWYLSLDGGATRTQLKNALGQNITGSSAFATLPTVTSPTTALIIASFGSCAVSGQASFLIVPSPSFTSVLVSTGACASDATPITFTRTVQAAPGTRISYSLVDAAHTTSYDIATTETVGAGMTLSGPLTLTADLSSVTRQTTLKLVADLSGTCGSTSVESSWSFTVTPPAQWATQPTAITTPWVSGFEGGPTMSAALTSGGQLVTWGWGAKAATANPSSDDLITTGAALWPGTITFADGYRTTLRPGYFAPAIGIMTNGSFESAPSIGTVVTLNTQASGLSHDLGVPGVVTLANMPGTVGAVQKSLGNASLKVASNGLLRVDATTDGLVEVGADPANLTGGEAVPSTTTAWLVFGTFRANASGPATQWQVECFDADRTTSLGIVSMDLAPVLVPTDWTTRGYLLKPNGGASAVQLPAGTAYFRPVLAVTGTTGGSSFWNLDDVRVIPISANEEAMLRSGGALSGAAVVSPVIHTFVTGMNPASTSRMTRNYYAIPTQVSACGVPPASSELAQATSESRLVVLSSPSAAGMTWDGSQWKVAVCQNQWAYLNAEATSGSAVNWQWEVSPDLVAWSVVAGETSSSMSAVTATTGTYYYRANVSTTHANGNIERKITKPICVVVTGALSGVTATTGTALYMSGVTPDSLAVSYAGGGTPAIQWASSPYAMGSWSAIPGATGASYTPPAQVANGHSIVGYDYRVTVTPGNGCGNTALVTSRSIGWVPPVGAGNITSQNSAVVCSGNEGASYRVTVQTTGVGSTSTLAFPQPVSIEWAYRINAGSWVTAIQSAAADGTSSFDVPSSALTANGAATLTVEVRATVTGLTISGGVASSASVTTPSYVIAVNPSVTLVSSPQNAGPLCSGTSTSLSAMATGQGVTYQWQELSPESGSVWSDISGAAGASYSAPALASPAAQNPDPSFEMGITEVTKLAGTGTYSLDGTTMAAAGMQSIFTSGGPITLATPASTTIPVSSSNYYLVLASAYSDTANQKMTLGLRCYDALGNLIAPQGAGDLVLFRPIPSATAVNVRPGVGGWIAVGGIVRGEGALAGIPGEAATFRSGTAAVRLVASMEENGGTGSAHLDNVRLVRLSQSEANLLIAGGGNALAAYVQARLGSNSDGISSRAFQYRVRFGNPNACGGSVLYSDVATVTATPSAAFVSVPDDLAICAGQGAQSLTVGLSGASGASLQWQVSQDGVTSWLPVTGATGATLAVQDVNATSAQIVRYYRLQVISPCGVLVTRAIRVAINPTAGLTQDLIAPPQVCDGQSLSMNIGVQAGTIQWEQQNADYSWSPILGATSATLALPVHLASATVPETRNYRVKNATTCGTLYSRTASVAIQPLLSITDQSPLTQSVCSGQTASFFVNASGGNLTYAWATSASAAGPWSPISSATGPMHSVTPTNTTANTVTTYYSVTVSGLCGASLTRVFALQVGPQLVLVAGPANQMDCSGTSKTLSVSATGAGLAYQWFETSPEGVTIELPNATSTLTVPMLASGPDMQSNGSFESGLGGITRLGGAATSTFGMDGTNPAAHGGYSVRTSGGEIVLRMDNPIPVDASRSYLLLANLSSPSAGAVASLGFECLDVNMMPLAPSGTADTRSFRVLAETSGVALTGAWTTHGGLVGGSAGAWNGGAQGPTPFRVGTAYIRLVASLAEGSQTAVTGLDNVRLVPVSGSESALLAARPQGTSIASYFEARAGNVSTGQGARTFQYRVVVSSTGGCVASTSASASVTSRPAPFFLAQPTPTTTICHGNQATLSFAMTAYGSPTITWQRSTDRVSWLPVPNSNSQSLQVTAPATGTTTTTWYYRADVITDCGTTSSRVAEVSIIPAPTFTATLSNKVVASGGSVSYHPTVDAHGAALAYQWSTSVDGWGWSNIQGATGLDYDSPVLTVPDGLTTGLVYYRVFVQGLDSCSSVVAPTSQVTIYPAIKAGLMTQKDTLCGNETADILVDLTSGVVSSHRWETSSDGGATWKVIVGQTGNTVMVQNPGGSGGGNLRVRATLLDAAGQTLTTAPLALAWLGSPVVTTQPLNQTIYSGQTVSFSPEVAANGNTVTYLWESSTDGMGWSQVAGGTSLALTTAAITVPDGIAPVTRYYRLQVLGGICGPVTSATATVTVYPTIKAILQPQGSFTGCSGSKITVDCVVTSGSQTTVHWQQLVNGVWTDQQTHGSYGVYNTATGVTPATTQVRALLTDASGQSVPTQAYTLTWTPRPLITMPPQPATTCAGGSVTFQTAYQAMPTAVGVWEVSTDGLAWSVATVMGVPVSSTTLTIPDAQFSAYYRYRVSVDGCPDTYSSSAALTVKPLVRIVQGPAPVYTACGGEDVTLTVQAEGASTYTWETNSGSGWVVATGMNGGSSYRFAAQNTSGSATQTQIRVRVSGECGPQQVSGISVVTVRPAISITSQPRSVDVCLGTPAALSVSVTGGTLGVDYTLQWQQDLGAGWQSIPGATGVGLTIPTSAATVYQVRAVLTSPCGQTPSDPATVKVSGATTITAQPQSVTACMGEGVVLTVEAMGASLSYRWERSLDGGATWQVVGASAPNLSVIATATAQYRVTVLGGGGCNDRVVSVIATISVNALPQQIPIKAPVYSIVGKQVYLTVVATGVTYDSVTWTFQGQTATGASVVFPCPTGTGTFPVHVSVQSAGCSSASVWNLDVVTVGSGDSDQNGVIEGVDLARLEAAYGTRAGEPLYDGVCDLNGDGVIDQADEDLLIARFGGNVQSGLALHVLDGPRVTAGLPVLARPRRRAAA